MKKILLWIFSILFFLLSITAFFIYRNFNRLLSEALIKSFNSNIISDVYEIKFEKLSLNFIKGDIHVSNVVFEPRKVPLRKYPYINSTLHLRTKRILLENVDLKALLKENRIKLDKIEIADPDIDMFLAGEKYIFFPFKDTANTAHKNREKKFIDSFFLKEFALTDASIHVKNDREQREFNIRKWSIFLDHLSLGQAVGKDMVALEKVEIMIGELTGNLKKGKLKSIYFKDFKIMVDHLNYAKTMDTLTFRFRDFSSVVHALDIQTADSNVHLAMQSFDLSYKDQSVKIRDVLIKPNVSNAIMQKKYKYQQVTASGSVGSIDILHLNFDSLIYHHKIYIGEINLDRVNASIYKDKTKPLDKNRFPQYFGQQIKKIPITLMIKHVVAKNINIDNTEKKPDGSIAKITVQRGLADIKNVTNLPGYKTLVMNASAYLENKVHFNIILGFSYLHPEFTMDGTIRKFTFSDLNPLLHAYTPARVNKGIVDEIKFNGTAFNTNSSGTLKFLYHDLDLDLKLKEKAEWKNGVISFAANSLLASANPMSPNQPPKIVNFHVDRDMNKGFINIILKSLLTGLKETMIMSKENRKAYKEAKKQAKKDKKKKDK